jgi:hypothetical protein
MAMSGGRVVTVLVAALLLAAALLQAWMPRSGERASGGERRDTPSVRIEASIAIYVDGVLRETIGMRSFLKPFPLLFALGLFPTQNFTVGRASYGVVNPSTGALAGEGSRVFAYGGAPANESVWGGALDPFIVAYDATGVPAAVLPLKPVPVVYSNETGVALVVGGSKVLAVAARVVKVALVRPTSGLAVRIAEDELPSPVTVGAGGNLTVVYTFFFESQQLFVENFAKVFYAWLFNSPSGKVVLTTIRKANITLDPSIASDGAAGNVPVNTSIVTVYLNVHASFNRTACTFADLANLPPEWAELALLPVSSQAEPVVEVYGGAIVIYYIFPGIPCASKEIALISRLKDGSEVMLMYAVPPYTFCESTPTTIAIWIEFPYEDRV